MIDAMRLPKVNEDWVNDQRRVWDRKSGLRAYYEREIFNRIIAELVPGQVLQLGSGAGFFSRYRPGMVNTDFANRYGIDVESDVHALPFAAGAFANVIGVDVLHHFGQPGQALRECTRVLRPGGRLILVEPWTGALGGLFYRHVHHEDCLIVDDPWTSPFAAAKSPMEGNTAIPRQILNDRRDELAAQVPGLAVRKVRYFGGASFLLTGGYQTVGLPSWVIRPLAAIEGLIPQAAMKALGLRAMFVLERQES
jgi:SAM-dependent methyltransferase